MIMQAGDIATMGRAAARPDPSARESSRGRKGAQLIILLEGRPGGDVPDSHVKVGRRAMSDTDTRVSIIVGVCQGDPERWREFDAIYRPILRAYLLMRRLKDSEIDEVTQDVWIKLLGKIQTYDRARCRFRSWLFGVTHNTLIDHARRRASYARALEGWAEAVLRASPSDSVRMEEEWRRIHREKILAHALRVVRARVSARAWTCFERRLLRDRPAAEIARELGIEPNAVFVSAHRVMKQVRAVCDEFDEDISHAFQPDVPER
jgi:RNA polymerase sigma-70 factor (ECF subfamily)